MEKINILGIDIHKVTKEQALVLIKKFAQGQKQRYAVTPNPEIILESLKNEELFYLLNQADLSLADGFGLKLAAWFLGQNLPRLAGADFVPLVLGLAQKNNWPVLVLNWRAGLSTANQIQTAVLARWPKLKLKVADISRRRKNFSAPSGFSPVFVFLAIGSPSQELLIPSVFKKMPSVRVAIACGGAFDFITGRVRRAPKVFRFLGLEWLWRLSQQPNRWRRIVRATLVFPYKFFLWRFVWPFFYRSNVACWLYKKEGNDYLVLLVERQDEPGHWQLPQGGLDGQSVAAAGARELAEEINCRQFKPRAVFGFLYKYKFNKELAKNKNKKHWGYKGQKQALFIAEFSGQDKDIKVNYYEHRAWQWASVEEVLNIVHPCRRPATALYLEKFKQAVK